ncbi:AraC family transcriptional regulator [bacterium]|nr:MAG: AraC family transcriptional regulator [bacterium]
MTVEVPTGLIPTRVVAGRSDHSGDPRMTFRVDGHWGLHLYRYSGELTMRGTTMGFESGWGGFTPPGEPTEYLFPARAIHLFLHLRLPVEASVQKVPALFNAGGAFPSLWERMSDVLTLQSADPTRATVRAWDILMESADLARRAAPAWGSEPEAVRRALAEIERRMGEEIGARELAEAAGISSSQLARLFAQWRGESPVQALRRRRVEHARHLLRATDLSVKQVAARVGIPDLQRFNKTVRQIAGVAPTRLRD